MLRPVNGSNHPMYFGKIRRYNYENVLETLQEHTKEIAQSVSAYALLGLDV
jgi:hypothetical protein